jgi:hypothetical protein
MLAAIQSAFYDPHLASAMIGMQLPPSSEETEAIERKRRGERGFSRNRNFFLVDGSLKLKVFIRSDEAKRKDKENNKNYGNAFERSSSSSSSSLCFQPSASGSPADIDCKCISFTMSATTQFRVIFRIFCKSNGIEVS